MQHARSPGRPRGPRAARWALKALAVVLAGCGGGFYIGIGGEDDHPPSVELAVSPERAAPGQALRLVAAASDDYGVDRVSFYRVDGATDTLLGVDREPPYALDTQVPNGAADRIEFFAHAVDEAGQSRSSALVAVEVIPR